ncbi:MAG: hypothetical protein IT323_00340 [Anaerolineae bacterium]|nr:hypothetical protein [Anaerolineae bacterium]
MPKRICRTASVGATLLLFACFLLLGGALLAVSPCLQPISAVDIPAQPLSAFMGTEDLDVNRFVHTAFAIVNEKTRPLASASMDLLMVHYVCQGIDCQPAIVGLDVRAKRHAACTLMGLNQRTDHEAVVQFNANDRTVEARTFPSSSSAPVTEDWAAASSSLNNVIEIAYEAEGKQFVADQNGQPYTLFIVRQKEYWRVSFGTDMTFNDVSEVTVMIDALTDQVRDDCRATVSPRRCP